LEENGMVKLYVINGPEIGQSFDIREGVMFLGRSFDNDIWINDRTISRKHLKILCKGNKFFVSDLASRNGTFYKGEYLRPGHEVELEEGEALAIGMIVLCLGEGCKEQMAPFLDTTSMIRRNVKEERGSEDRRKKTLQKRHELLSRVSVTLKDKKPLDEILRNVLAHIFNYLKRIDRGAFVLVDPAKLTTEKTICLSTKSRVEGTPLYSDKVAQKVLSTGKPLVFSKACTANEEGLVDTLKLQKIESVICVPLMGGSQVFGIMYIDSLKRPDGFRRDDFLDLLDIGQRVALAVQKERVSLDVLKIATTLSEESQE
jgi:pSer/pThr/pTyr-binding forkhead associated (FHA) protein